VVRRNQNLTQSPFAWLVAGVGAIGSGIVLALSVSFEAGVAVAVLGVAALGASAALFLAPSATDQTGLGQRLKELQEVEQRMLATGVSQTEQAYQELRQSRSVTEGSDETAPATALDANERRLGEMIRTRCDRVWEGIRTQRYVKRTGGRVVDLDGGALFSEIRDVVQEVAALYHSESTNAVLEVRTGDIALAIRSAAGELLQTVRQIPYVDPASWSIHEVVARLETVEKGLALYKKLSPYDHYITGAMLAARIAVGANPISLAAWVLGKEGAKRIGGKLLKTRAEAWIKELLEGSVALVYLQVARTYDPERTYRSAEWVVLVEALRIHAQTPGIDHNRKFLLDRILRAPIPDEFAKLALLRALADDSAPDPRSAPSVDLAKLHPAERQAIGARLADLLPALHGLNAVAARQAIEDLERRLQWGLAVDVFRSGNPEERGIAEGYSQLARLSRLWLDITREEAPHAIAVTTFGTQARKSIGHSAADRQLRQAVAVAYDSDDPGGERNVVEPPRGLVGHTLAGPLVESVAALLSATAEWPIEHDHVVLMNASVLLPERKQVLAAWKHYVTAASRQLRNRLVAPNVATWPPRSAPAILRRFRDTERAVAVFDAKTPTSRDRWLLVFVDRVVVGEVPDDELSIDDGEVETHPIAGVRFTRRSQRLGDELVVYCGGHRLNVVSGRNGSFERRFGPLLAQLALRVDALQWERAGF